MEESWTGRRQRDRRSKRREEGVKEKVTKAFQSEGETLRKSVKEKKKGGYGGELTTSFEAKEMVTRLRGRGKKSSESWGFIRRSIIRKGKL